MNKIKHMMFDFDGTLADTSEGIVRSMHYAYDKLGREHEADERIKNSIGPPLETMFSILLSTEDELSIKQAVTYFRERYAKEGVRELCLYPGVKETLSTLSEAGIMLYIVTSKPEKFVHEICEEQGIKAYFKAMTGVSTRGKSLSKAERMGLLMQEYGITPDNGIMVGDRPEDANAAKANQVGCVGVTYGFGKREELHEAGCIQILDRLQDLMKVIE